MTTISGFVYRDTIGNIVSMDVAPAGAMVVYLFKYFAINGMLSTAKTSLKTLVKNAMAPISAESSLVSKIPDKLYQPKPALIAKLILVS